MSVKDFIKKSVLENFSPYNVPQMAAALLAAVLLGALIYWVYQRFYAGVLFSRSFAMTLVGMSVLTCMVTLAISSNVVISLGMVGALSIVRSARRSRTRWICCICSGPSRRASPPARGCICWPRRRLR